MLPDIVRGHGNRFCDLVTLEPEIIPQKVLDAWTAHEREDGQLNYLCIEHEDKWYVYFNAQEYADCDVTQGAIDDYEAALAGGDLGCIGPAAARTLHLRPMSRRSSCARTWRSRNG